MTHEPWTKRYLPRSSVELIQEKAQALKDFILNYRKQKRRAAIVHGPVGCGKTSSVYAIANEAGLEILELNASDLRNEDSIQAVAGNAARQMSLFSKGKIILIDEVDGIAGREDRGGTAAIAKIMEETAFPIVMTANDPFEKKLDTIRKKSLLIEYSPIPYQAIHEALKKVCGAESITYEEQDLKALALRAGGDLRGAINDLQLLSQNTLKLDRTQIESLSDRDRTARISDALLRIFKSTDINLAITALDNIDEELERCAMWIDENLPQEYKNPEDLKEAYNHLSRADVFTGRIRRWQHWRFLVYVNALISAGVAISKKQKNRQPTNYKQPSRPLKKYIANLKYAKMNATAQKLAEKTRESNKTAIQQHLPYLRMACIKSRETAELIAQELELSPEEKNWLCGR
ncbi:replication factor C large subunit [Candidatus Woesearchaeota archaeon]|nr:replication factor C large subunit [Candidatus Woesearchaeota archaeon]